MRRSAGSFKFTAPRMNPFGAIRCWMLAWLLMACSAALAQTGPNGTVTFIPLATNAYGTDDLNSCGIIRDNLVTIGGYQFVAYYQYNNPVHGDSSGTIVVGRRAIGSTSWTLDNTGITVTVGTNGVSSDSIIGNGIDDHDVVAMAVDGNGEMHLSWGMHNVALNYDISSNSVTGSTFAPSFVQQTPTNNPSLFSTFTQTGIDQVTYPEFYYVPNANGTPSGNLIFDFRNPGSASGGGSGNGNTYFTEYNASTGSFADPEEVLDGSITSVNGYQNSLVYDSNGNLLMSWTWRATPNYQTNENILFAQSPNNGVTWYQQGGTTQYTLPIVSNQASGTVASQVAQIVENIPQNSSLINQSWMTVDKNNNPVIATWLTPDGNASEGVSLSNNPNRQYMLYYYTGTQWDASQITDRQNDTEFDTSGDYVRDLARPVVLIDNSNRVLVVTRSEDSGLIGGAIPTTLANNNIVVYWNTMASLDSPNPAAWNAITLDTANMGEWEPTYDEQLWQTTNTLDLFYEPVGLSGETKGTAQILQWNESQYFSTLSNASSWSSTGSGNWNLYSNWSGQIPNGVGLEADLFGAISSPQTVYTNQPITLGTLHFNNASEYQITGLGSITMQTASGSALVQVDQGTGAINLPLILASNTTFNVAGGATLLIANPLTIDSGVTLTQTGSGAVNYQSIVTVQSGGDFDFGASSNIGSLSLASGSSAKIAGVGAAQVAHLGLSGAAALDIGQGELAIDYGSNADPINAIVSYLTSGYNNGLWNGAGINSSFVASHPGYGVGYADAAGVIDIEPALLGDATLSGTVDYGDFQILAANFGHAGRWDQGNFLYGSTIDFADFAALAGNMSDTSSLAAAQFASLQQFASGFGDELSPNSDGVGFQLVSVPEPAAGLLALAGFVVVARRQRGRSRPNL
ncbi:MAG TPA: BNR-4 repeat-containing protein [Tepidisphaeraceae bacterium]|nr:BNR-4 repeat-containing protein [Tepidisphaeraceae bacterium]